MTGTGAAVLRGSSEVDGESVRFAFGARRTADAAFALGFALDFGWDGGAAPAPSGSPYFHGVGLTMTSGRSWWGVGEGDGLGVDAIAVVTGAGVASCAPPSRAAVIDKATVAQTNAVKLRIGRVGFNVTPSRS